MNDRHIKFYRCPTAICFICTLGIGFVFFQGCGKKSLPKAPEVLAPSPVMTLTARGDVEGVILSWEAPTTRANGETLNDLFGFVVRRSLFKKDQRANFKTIGEILIEKDEESGDPKTSPFSFTDKDVKAGVIYEYIVVPLREGRVEGRSDTILRITFLGQSSLVENIH